MKRMLVILAAGLMLAAVDAQAGLSWRVKLYPPSILRRAGETIADAQVTVKVAGQRAPQVLTFLDNTIDNPTGRGFSLSVTPSENGWNVGSVTMTFANDRPRCKTRRPFTFRVPAREGTWNLDLAIQFVDEYGRPLGDPVPHTYTVDSVTQR